MKANSVLVGNDKNNLNSIICIEEQQQEKNAQNKYVASSVFEQKKRRIFLRLRENMQRDNRIPSLAVNVEEGIGEVGRQNKLRREKEETR